VRQHRTLHILAAATGVASGVVTILIAAAPAHASPSCSRTVIFTTPGVTWSDVTQVKPPTVMSLTREGAVGSMSVHTDSSRPSYSSSFVTIGAGARMPGFESFSETDSSVGTRHLMHEVQVSTPSELHALSARSGYGARPGALAQVLNTPVVAIGDAATSQTSSGGFAQWPLLAAMNPSGRVEYAATGEQVLNGGAQSKTFVVDAAGVIESVREALALHCATIVLDVGDLERAQVAGAPLQEALLSTDGILHDVVELLDLRRDLLLVLSPTSPAVVTHLGVAVAVGPEFQPGSVLESASTRRPGIVTLPDVAPTVLAHFGVSQPSVMNGQSFFSAPSNGDRIAAAEDLDREAVFVDAAKPAMSWVFLLAELGFFAVAIAAMWLRSRKGVAPGHLGRVVKTAALAVAGLPVVTFLVHLVPDSDLGRPGFIGLCLLLDAVAVTLISTFRSSPLERLGLLSALSLVIILADLVTGGHLQLNSVLGDSPLIAGRFSGAGNNAFAILAATAVVCGTVLVWRRGPTRVTLLQLAGVFAVVILVDGAPQFGSDIGGVLALVPGFAVAWMLLGGKRISLKLAALGIVGAMAAAGLFVAVDLSRPPQQRTHLGRFFEDVRSRGGSALTETVKRKASSNLRQARSFQNLYRFLPGALVTAFFLFWPPRWWQRFGTEEPLLRAGCIAALIVALLGSGLNDSGITIFTTMLLFLAPMAILIRLFPEPQARPGVG
jgi:hypothetical protein